MMKKILAMMLFYMASSHAALIVDTGTPTDTNGADLYQYQYFAAQFNLDQSETISSIQGYFSNQWGSGTGTMDIAITADVAGKPSTNLFFSSISLDAGQALDWYGLSSLDWLLQAGTYWVTFIPTSVDFYGLVPGSAPLPLEHYLLTDFSGNWGQWSNFAAGIRIESGVTSVPESTMLMLFISGLLGLSAVRSRASRSA
ncbi:hypothetical protein [Neptunicella sp. SCSIO 80796]|uniref:hypothetical protein n=1 Tax=Neptunicella plasticusilytica TaxID=3117012 RepID=UPI003A4E4328